LILVFGAGGQIGRELQTEAALQNIALAALPRERVDICDAAAVAGAIFDAEPAVVINAAAYTRVDRAESESKLAHRSNALGPHVIASVCAQARTPLIHISTDCVFDGAKSCAYVETDPIAPLGVYGQSKAAGEAAVRAALTRHIILRTSWVYGEYGANFLTAILRLAKEQDELRIVADQRGCPTSARDIASALLRLAARLQEGGDDIWGTYHFAGRGETTWHGFACRIVAAQAALTGRAPKVAAIATSEYPTAARRLANSVLNCDRFECVFGFGGRPWTAETDAITRRIVGADERETPANA
jgi:dTDP-4-dehydrorhamnose reductase